MIEHKGELYFITYESRNRILSKIPTGMNKPVKLIEAGRQDPIPMRLYSVGDKMYAHGFHSNDPVWMRYDEVQNQMVEIAKFPGHTINHVYWDSKSDQAHFFLATTDLMKTSDRRFMLWYSDGTSEGTKLIDSVSVAGNINLGQMFVAESKFFCVINRMGANETTWPVLNVVDGPSGTIRELSMDDETVFVGAKGLSSVGDYVIFNAAKSADVLHSKTKVEHTLSYNLKTGEIHSLNKTSPKVRPRFLPAFNHDGRLYFSYGENTSQTDFDRELWVTDGTPEGTEYVHPIWSFTGYYNKYNIATKGDEIYFPGGELTHGFEIWKISTKAKTIQMVTNFEHRDGSNYVSSLTTLGKAIIFGHANLTYGEELWIHDKDGTRLLKDINDKPELGF